jgi:putative addiction module antidote
MTATVEVTTVGTSVGIVLPKEVLADLNVAKGDTLFISSAPDGVRLSAYDPEFAEQMKAMDYVMRKHRDVLRKLAE